MMNDAIGCSVTIGDTVAFYGSPKAKTTLGRVVRFNKATMVVVPFNKKSSVLKSSDNVIKVSLENVKTEVFDSIGNELKVGDFVAMTLYSSKLVFGEIKNIKGQEVNVRIKNKLLKKLPSQLVKVSEEQMTLVLFSR